MFFKWELNKKIPWVWTLIAMTIGSAFTMFAVQYLILDSENFWKTADYKLVMNAMIVGIGYLLMLFITNSVRISCILAHTLFLLFGFVDYFVWQFRQNEFTIGDILGAGTGLSVSKNYTFSLNSHAIMVLVATAVYFVLIWQLKVNFKVRWQMMLMSALMMICLGVYVATGAIGVNTETWEQKGSYRNGYLLNFCLEIRDCFVGEPDGYSSDAIAELEDEYQDKESDSYTMDTSLEEGEKPTIIVIMNESFADLSVIGDLETNQEVMPNISSLTENTIKGYALSSVYGAKTPNSEWEFLTGNSMAFLPDGSVVYQQYLKKNATSLVSTLKNEGYTAVAMHPYYSTGWSRDQAYPSLGFDETYFIDDFDQTQVLREYITDEELYNKIIDRFESKEEDENLFIMSVTMQNHGGYTTDYANFTEDTYKLGLSYNDVNQYLSLVHESDRAVGELISYFKSQDKPVEIVFFGDHQPGLNSAFYQLLNGKGLSGLTENELEDLYKVPFFIWTNYDSEESADNLSSLNYLSTLALEKANIELPAYNKFLADMMEEIPAINARGYYSNSLGGFKHVDDATGEEAEWIENYNILEYNNMFDTKNKSSLFFPFLE